MRATGLAIALRDILCFWASVSLLVSLASAQMVPVVPSDLANYDVFGISVSVDAGYLLVGSMNDDDSGTNSGSAYLFDLPTDDGPAGYELIKLTPSNGQAYDSFGYSVSLQDGLALIGTPGSDALAADAGCAYLFDANPSSPTFGAQLMWLVPGGADASDNIGRSVALGSGLALVGAWRDDDNGKDAGAAYLFDADPSSPTFGQVLFKLTPSDGLKNHLFGGSVSMADGLALVGAQVALGVGTKTGAAYLFDVDPTSSTFGAQLAKFVDHNGGSGDRFGFSVSLSDGRALVGAPDHDRPEFSSTDDGAAFLFDATPASPTFGVLLTELLPAHTYPHHRGLGSSVSLDGRFAVLGSPWEDFPTPWWTKWNIWKAGAAYVFDVDASSPNFSSSYSKFRNPIPANFERFGHSVCVQDGVVAVGVPYDATWKYNAGSVFVTRLVGLR